MIVTLVASISLLFILILLKYMYISYQKLFLIVFPVKNINHIYTFSLVLVLYQIKQSKKTRIMSYWDSTVLLSFHNFTKSENKMNITFRHRKQLHHASIALRIILTGVSGPADLLFFVFDFINISPVFKITDILLKRVTGF